MTLKNKLINHIDKIKEIVLENELLKYAVKSLQNKLQEKNNNIQQKKIDNFNIQNNRKPLFDKMNKSFINQLKQPKIVHFNTAQPQQFERRNIRNFVKNVQSSLESQRQPPKQSHPKIFIILKRKKFI